MSHMLEPTHVENRSYIMYASVGQCIEDSYQAALAHE